MTGAGSQQGRIVRRVSKTSAMKNSHGPGGLSCPSLTLGKGLAWGEMGYRSLPTAGLCSFSCWAHPPPGPHSPETLPVWRSRAASHDPLPGLEGEVSEETCAEWRGTENPRKGQMGSGEKEPVPRAPQC